MIYSLSLSMSLCYYYVTSVVSNSVRPRRPHSPPGSPVPGILQARTLEWVAISFSNAWKWKVKVKSLSRVPTLSDPMDCSLPGSSAHGIFQAGVLEWGAIVFSAKSLFKRLFQCFLLELVLFTDLIGQFLTPVGDSHLNDNLQVVD